MSTALVIGLIGILRQNAASMRLPTFQTAGLSGATHHCILFLVLVGSGRPLYFCIFGFLRAEVKYQCHQRGQCAGQEFVVFGRYFLARGSVRLR
jgi:hypothetical protein